MKRLPTGRHAVALIAFAAAIATVAAGANAQVSAERIGLASAPHKMVLRMATPYSNSHPQTVFAEGMTALYDRFAKAHPDWQIEIQLMTSNIGQEHARLLEQLKTKRGPDCSALDSFQVPLFVSQGVLKPVTQYFTKAEIDDLFPFVKAGVTGPDGQIYAWWWHTDLRVLYRNKELVPEAPQTWDELKTAAAAAAKKGVDGIVFNAGRGEVTTIDFLGYFWSQGGQLLDASGAPVFAEGANRVAMSNALNFYKDLVQSGGAPKRVTTIAAYDDLLAATVANRTAMMQGGHWQWMQMQAAMKPEQFAKWDVSPQPGKVKGKTATGTGGWTIAAMSEDPAKNKLCMDLAREVYMGPANEVLDRIPTRVSQFDTLKHFQTPYYAKMRDYLKDGRARPGLPIYPEVSNQIQVMIGEVVSGSKTTDAALNDAGAAAKRAYAKK